MQHKTTREHYEKYAAMALAIGAQRLIPLVPATKEHLEKCYPKDQNLNNIPLWKWDGWKNEMDRYKQANQAPNLLNVYHILPRSAFPKGGLSLAEVVCLLKHVAIFHILGCEPVFDK